MTENTRPTKESLLESYLEKMAAVQVSVRELNAETNQLRQDARTDGFNMEAVHMLSIVRCKSPHDGGQALLRDMVKYAQQIGLELEMVAVQSDSASESADSNKEDENPNAYRYRGPLFAASKPTVIVLQLALGLAVSGAFLWFLH